MRPFLLYVILPILWHFTNIFAGYESMRTIQLSRRVFVKRFSLNSLWEWGCSGGQSHGEGVVKRLLRISFLPNKI
jgi:hypothetical protein